VIQTVHGPIAPEALGVTLAHEHLLGRIPALDDPESPDDLCLDDEAVAASELRLFFDAGGRSLVELTVEGLSPAPLSLRRLADQAGVQIVAGVGLYRANAHPDWVKDASVGQLKDHFMNGLWYGISGTPVRGGVLGELRISSLIHSDEVKVLRAAARSQRRTGVGIMISVETSSRQEQRALDILQAEGVDLRRVALIHMSEVLDHEYLCSLAVRGAWLCFDTFGRDAGEIGDRRRVEALDRLLQAGWAGQLLLSQDVCSRRHLVTHGGKGYAHVVRSVVPALKATGVSQETIGELLVQNPGRFLSGES